MIRRLAFNPIHVDLMDVRPLDRDSVLCLDKVRFVLQNMPPDCEAVTLMHNGRIIACMGYWMPFPHMAEVWVISSIYVKEVPFLFVRTVECYLRSLAETFKWTRVQTVTRTDLFHRRWMQALQFNEEGVMKNYFGGQDYILSARYFDWSQP